MKHEKGIVIYLALITLSAALATALFVAGVFVKEYKISRDVVNSLNAVYVADSITEFALYYVRVPATPLPTTLTVTNCASDKVPSTLVANTGCRYSIATDPSVAFGGTVSLCSAASQQNCVAGDTCTQIVSNGAYSGTNRAMEIVYCNK